MGNISYKSAVRAAEGIEPVEEIDLSYGDTLTIKLSGSGTLTRRDLNHIVGGEARMVFSHLDVENDKVVFDGRKPHRR